MSYNQKKMLEDVAGDLIPQMFEPSIDEFVPLEKMEYYGRSTDSKPSNVAKGASFLELDTGKLYFYDGNDWIDSDVW